MTYKWCFFGLIYFRWKKGSRLFQTMAIKEVPNFQEHYEHLMDKSMLEIYKLYFDTEMEDLFINSTESYARMKNDQSFTLSKDQLWDFLSIISISTFNMRP